MLLLSLWVGLIGGCNDSGHDVLRFGLQSAPLTLNPLYATDAASTRINRLLYQRLVEFDAESRPVPGLADWSHPAPRHYRFVLRPEREPFHDGTELTAKDVQATYQYVLDPRHASPHRATLANIVRIEAPDAETVDFYLNHADPLFPSYLVLGIVPAHLLATPGTLEHHPVGNGAFRFVAWPDEGLLQLQRRSDGLRVDFVRVADPTVRVLKLLRGEIDMLQNDLPAELIRYLAQRPDIRLQRVHGSNFSYLGFNLADPATGNLEVRRAIAHAIDRASIIRYVLGGAALPADAIFPADHWAGAAELGSYSYDPARARALLQAAGYGPDHPVRLIYKTSNDPFRVRLATIVQSQLHEVGIEVQLRSYDWGTFYGDIKGGRFQLYSLSWVGIHTPDIFRYAFHSHSLPPDGANRGRFSSTTVDRLIETAESLPDMKSQAVVYRRLQQQLLSELPYVPLWYEDHVFAARAGTRGYRLAPDGEYDGLCDVQPAWAPRVRQATRGTVGRNAP